MTVPPAAPSPPAAPGDLPRGTRLGRYRIEEPVGRGGMGTVYAAYDDSTHRMVALKILAPGLSKQLQSRFLAECEAEANIRHENVMPVYDRGWLSEERPYFAMELLYEPITLGDIRELDAKGMLGIEQPRLRQWSDRRRLIQDVLVPVIEGVGVANSEYGSQHRDLKPDNVLVDIRTRRPYLIDFGICRRMDDPAPTPPIIVGTPRFLSPEQARGTVDARTDVWGCGALLRYVLTAEPPLEGTSPFTRREVNERVQALGRAESEARAKGQEAQARGYRARRSQLEDPELRVQDDLLHDAREGRYLPLPSNVDPGLAAVIHKAMAPDANDRYSTVNELAKDLRAWLQGEVTQATQESGRGDVAAVVARRAVAKYFMRAAAATVALGVGVLLGLGLFQDNPEAANYRVNDAAAESQSAAAALAADNEHGVQGLDGLERHRFDLERAGRAAQRASGGAPPAPAAQGENGSGRGNSDLTTIDWGASEWRVRELLGGADWNAERTSAKPRTQGSGRTPLRQRREGASTYAAPALSPGLYQLQSLAPRGLDLRLCVSPVPATRPDPLALLLAPLEQDIPQGMLWVPAGISAPDSADVEAPFLAMLQRVTHFEYGEWLDELDAKERPRHVPAKGFQRDPSDPTRYVPDPAHADQPVRGLAPRSMALYAAWRGSVEGLDLALPTPAQWRRMAGIDLLNSVGAHRLLPFGEADGARAASRGAWREPPLPTFQEVDVSPFGMRALFTGGGEVVQVPAESGFAVSGAGGCLPHASCLLRRQAITPTERNHNFGFRLVANIE